MQPRLLGVMLSSSSVPADPRFRDSALRACRIRRGLSQTQLADLAGVHVNSIRKIENSITREVSEDTAARLCHVLQASADQLGLRVRKPVPPSIRLRQLSVEQRELLDEILSLPPNTFEEVRETVRAIRARESHGRRRKEKRHAARRR